MKKILLMAVIAILTVGMSVRAEEKKIPERQNVPAYKGIIERVQPNGDTLRTYLRGDERHHWMMTEDGWQILETKKKLAQIRQKEKGRHYRSKLQESAQRRQTLQMRETLAGETRSEKDRHAVR